MRDKSSPRIHPVTDAPRSHTVDVRSREVRYLLSMGVRTLCFVLAFVTSGPLRWGFVVAAFILPYIAVVAANAGRERRTSDMPHFITPSDRSLPSGSAERDEESTYSKRNRG